MTAKIVQLAGTATEDEKPALMRIADGLRVIADDIEANHYGGETVRMAGVLRVYGQPPIVFALGETDSSARACMDLHAGAQQLMGMSNPQRT